MSAPKKVFGIILAGGEGKRLMPLTADRAKPAVPFGGQYRLIDFAISNLINSGLRQIVVLTQYKSHSLDRHISQTWRMSALLDSYVASVPAQQRLGKRWFSGSADAILQSMNLINDEKPDIVVVIGADHVYRMDFRQMLEAHIASGAKATVAGIRQPIALASQFGVIDADSESGRIKQFLEKPTDATGLDDSPHEVLASMGNYIFDADALIAAVEADGESPVSGHDMGGDIVPYFVDRGEAGYYDMKQNEVPGSSPRDRSYWRDVGTIDSFFDAHRDLISTLPIFNLYNMEWPIHSQAVNSRPRSSSATPSDASATRSTRSSRSAPCSRARISSGVWWGRGPLREGVHDHRLGRLRPCACGARGPRAQGDPRQERRAGGRCDGRCRPRTGPVRGFTVTESGITVVGKGVFIER